MKKTPAPDMNEQIEAEAQRLYNVHAGNTKGTPTHWSALTNEARTAWISVAIAALRADQPQYRIAVVTNKLGIAHLRLLGPRGGEIILDGENLYSVSNGRRQANRLATIARRGFRVVEVDGDAA